MAALELAFESDSPEATRRLGEALGQALFPGAVIGLRGEMGAGKTTFVQGLARGLGVPGDVTSPTFTLMTELEGRLPLYHFDAWMAARETSLLADGGAELLEGPGVAVVEWAERVEAWLPAARLELEFSHVSPERRQIRIRLPSEQPSNATYRALLAHLAALPADPALRPLSLDSPPER